VALFENLFHKEPSFQFSKMASTSKQTGEGFFLFQK